MLLSQAEVNKTIEDLRATMKGLGTNEKKLIKILGDKTLKQMSQIMSRYHNSYGRTLYQHIDGELSGSFGSLCKGVSVPILEYDCDLIYKACNKIFTANYTYLTEVLVGRTNHDINAIKTYYEDKYHEKVENVISRKCYGDMEKLYLTCLEGKREENKEYTEEDINNDVNTLYQATLARWNSSEKELIDILCHRQFQHLRNVFFAFENKYKKPITTVIEEKFVGPIEKNFLILVKSAMDRYQFIAEEFNKAMYNNSLKSTKLIRYTIRYRTPIILETIKEIYNTNYKKTFGEDLNNATFIDKNTRNLIFLLLQEKREKDNDDDDDSKGKSRDIDNFEDDEVPLSREVGDFETIQVVASENDDQVITQIKEE